MSLLYTGAVSVRRYYARAFFSVKALRYVIYPI